MKKPMQDFHKQLTKRVITKDDPPLTNSMFEVGTRAPVRMLPKELIKANELGEVYGKQEKKLNDFINAFNKAFRKSHKAKSTEKLVQEPVKSEAAVQPLSAAVERRAEGGTISHADKTKMLQDTLNRDEEVLAFERKKKNPDKGHAEELERRVAKVKALLKSGSY